MKKQVQKNLSLLILIFLSALFSFCGGKPNSNTTNATEIKQAEEKDTVVSGTIKKMCWNNYQSMGDGEIIMSDGNELTISTDFLGEHGTGRIFINPEVKDILFLDKEKSMDRLNAKYLDKNVKVSYKKSTGTISKIELTGGEKDISTEPKVLVGFITGINEDNKTGAKFIAFKNENGGIKNLRLYLDADNHYTVTSIFNGTKGVKSDFVFCTKNYSLALVPSHEDKKVKVTYQYKLIKEVDASNGEKSFLFNDDAVTEIEWAN